jgi:hypothetical protein
MDPLCTDTLRSGGDGKHLYIMDDRGGSAFVHIPTTDIADLSTPFTLRLIWLTTAIEIMSTATTNPPSETPSYYELALEAIAHSGNYTETQHQDAKDCLTFMRPASNWKQQTDKAASRSRLIQKNPDILAAGGKIYTKYHTRKMAARILSRLASKAEQSILNKHGVDYDIAYRLSGAPNDDGVVRDSIFASKKDDNYRLLRFNSRGECEEKEINELGLRSRFELAAGRQEKDARRKPCGTYCSNIDDVTAWTLHQAGDTYTKHREGIGSIRTCAADVRAVLNLPDSSVNRDENLRAKNRLWKSKYNHPKLRGAYPNGGPKQGAMEMLCGRFAAETVLSRDPESDTVRYLKSRYTDLSQAILLECETNENGSFDEKDLSIARSSFFLPANPETSQSVDPFDQFYDLVSIANGEISIVEHTVGEMIGKLAVANKPTKSRSSKRREEESEAGGAGPSIDKRPRVVSR